MVKHTEITRRQKPRIVWMCLTILWGFLLKRLKVQSQYTNITDIKNLDKDRAVSTKNTKIYMSNQGWMQYFVNLL